MNTKERILSPIWMLWVSQQLRSLTTNHFTTHLWLQCHDRGIRDTCSNAALTQTVPPDHLPYLAECTGTVPVLCPEATVPWLPMNRLGLPMNRTYTEHTCWYGTYGMAPYLSPYLGMWQNAYPPVFFCSQKSVTRFCARKTRPCFEIHFSLSLFCFY